MTLSPGGTPREQGFRMPAEWSRHAATWIAWPHNASDWPGKFQAISWVYADIVRHLAAVEDVHILVNDAASEKRARGVLTRSGVRLTRVHFHQWPTNRVWMRDSGPIFVKNSQDVTAITNWKFNAWAKYDDWQLDDGVPDHVAGLLGLPEWKPTLGEHRIVLEGGSIDTNGAGVLLTTEECLLSEVQQRNPGLSREDLERAFQEYLGIEQVIWLNRGIAGDDTHGHVDDITRFVGEKRIITVMEASRDDENYEPLQENLDRLKSARSLKGDTFEIVELPMPAPVVFDGRRLPASYGNFYIANDLVLVPTFNDPNDRKAMSVLAEVFPGRKVTGIHCGDLIWGLGALHCMTQQQPL
jgi:agmatine deiminase